MAEDAAMMPGGTPRPERSPAGMVWTGIALLISVVVLQEALIRFLFPLPELKGFNRIHYMPVGPAGKAAGAVRSIRMVVESSPDHLRVAETLNEYGFRGGRWHTRKADGTRRVIFVGDSYVEGILAGEGHTVPDAFRSEASTRDVRVETLNMGVAAAGLSAYVELIVDTVPVFRPDAVLLVLYANDLPDNAALPQPRGFTHYAWSTPRLIELFAMASRQEMLPYRWPWKEVRQNQPVPSPNNPWSDTAFIAENERYVTPPILEAMKAGGFNPFRMGGSLYLERTLRMRFDIRPILGALRDYVDRHGSRLYVAYVPDRGTVTNHYKQFERSYSRGLPTDLDMTLPPYHVHRRLLQQQCAEQGIPFLDVTETIVGEERAGRHLYLDFDDHMREIGYRTVGKAIFDWWSRDAPGGERR